jgi:amino acid transporter
MMAFLCIAIIIILIIHVGFFVTIKFLFMLVVYFIIIMGVPAFILSVYDVHKQKKDKKNKK